MRSFARAAAAVAAFALTGPALSAQAPPSVFLEELTWTEVRDAIDGGRTTVIVPSAGTEQNGPHMVLGKHRYIVTHAAGRIAETLGNALVAPTMRMAGTITLPNEFFMKTVEYAARSLAVHGFTDIVFIGDSGGNQRGMSDVADMLNAEWSGTPTRVHFVGDYYGSNDEFVAWLGTQGITPEQVGSHAGVSDTSQLLFVAPEHVRSDARAPGGGYEGSGVSGDPTLATAEIGRMGIQFKVDAAVRQIRALMGQRSPRPGSPRLRAARFRAPVGRL